MHIDHIPTVLITLIIGTHHLYLFKNRDVKCLYNKGGLITVLTRSYHVLSRLIAVYRGLSRSIAVYRGPRIVSRRNGKLFP